MRTSPLLFLASMTAAPVGCTQEPATEDTQEIEVYRKRYMDVSVANISSADVGKVMGGNFFRVWEAATGGEAAGL